MDNIQAGSSPTLPPTYPRTRERRRPIVGPAILIGLGLLFLAQNLGLLPGDLWSTLWRFWPVLLVLAGIELIFTRRSWPATIGILIVALVIGFFAAATTLAGQVGRWSWGSWSFGAAQPAQIERVTEELGDARRASVNLQHSAGRLTIGALPDGSAQLIDANLAHGENTAIVRRLDRRGDQAVLDLRAQTARDVPPIGEAERQDWTINLSPEVPQDLQIQSGAGEVELDLAELTVTRMDLETGAGEVEVTLPRAAGRTEAQIQTGAGDVDVTIPDGVAARIEIRGGLTDTTVDESRFPRVGTYYQSPDYDTAQNQIDLDIETGIGEITVR